MRTSSFVIFEILCFHILNSHAQIWNSQGQILVYFVSVICICVLYLCFVSVICICDLYLCFVFVICICDLYLWFVLLFVICISDFYLWFKSTKYKSTKHKSQIQITDTNHKYKTQTQNTDTNHRYKLQIQNTNTNHKYKSQIQNTNTNHKYKTQTQNTDTKHRYKSQIQNTNTLGGAVLQWICFTVDLFCSDFMRLSLTVEWQASQTQLLPCLLIISDFIITIIIININSNSSSPEARGRRPTEGPLESGSDHPGTPWSPGDPPRTPCYLVPCILKMFGSTMVSMGGPTFFWGNPGLNPHGHPPGGPGTPAKL